MPDRRAPRSWRLATAVASVLALLVFAAACTDDPVDNGGVEESPPEVVGPRNGGRLVVALADDTANWNPAAAPWTPSEFEVGRGSTTGSPSTATRTNCFPSSHRSIEPNSDFTEWTITLREDIVFHGGAPLDAATLKANLEAQQLSPVAGSLLAPVKSIFTTGPRTVRISMRSPWSTFAHTLTSQIGFIASPATLSTPEGAAQPVGTGPFVFTSAVAGQSLDAVKNSSYWRDGLPRLDDVSFLCDPRRRREDDRVLVEGRVDMALADDPATILDLREASTTGRINLLLDRDAEAPKLTFVFNTGRPPFLDPVARHAVVTATDRAAMTAAGYDGVLVPAKGPISDESVWFIDQAYPPRDVDEARQDVERYTEIYGLPLAFTLKVPSQPVYLRFAALWQQQLRQAGIEVTIVIQDEQLVRLATAIGDFEAALLPLFGDWHPDTYYPAWHRVEYDTCRRAGVELSAMGNRRHRRRDDRCAEVRRARHQVDAYRKVENDLFVGNAYLFLLRLPQAVAA